jgi:serine/threonine protein kinase
LITGQTIFIGNQVAYELGNYLGGGAAGSVYQATDMSSRNGPEKSVAIKILNPLGFKILPFGQLNKCIVASKGQPLTQEQLHGKETLTVDNVWWLVHPTSEQVYAAYEDSIRGQLRELTLPKCIEVWGWNPSPLGMDQQLSAEAVEKHNFSGNTAIVGPNIVPIPVVAPKYLKWLLSRATICREMNNMITVGEHPNIVELMEVLELIQDSKSVLFLVLEFINGGELFDRMKRNSGGACASSEGFARRYFCQLLSGLEYCHRRGKSLVNIMLFW